MSGMDRRRHGFDTQESNLINCPQDKTAPWSWAIESSLDNDTNFPPFCPACGERVEVWQVTGEFDDDPVLEVPSARPNLDEHSGQEVPPASGTRTRGAGGEK